MSNLETLDSIFCEVFSVDAATLDPNFDNKSVEGWDSVRQLNLTSSIEDAFDIMLDPEDILEFTSYENAKAIVAKYGIIL